MPTAKYAVLGYPVKHSVSPPMQGAAFAAAQLAATYEAIEVAPADLPALFARLRDTGYAGWNVTVPHKEQAARLVAWRDDEAELAASVNTVLVRDGRLLGYSTDGYGIVTALREAFALELAGHTVALVGTGGAGRAAALALVRHGVAGVILVNRTLERARELEFLLRRLNPACALCSCSLQDEEAVRDALGRADALVQATSLGLKPDDPPPLPGAWLPTRLRVFDMIYRRTALLAAAAERGCAVADGRLMLLHQGARSFTLWTGMPAPVEAMRQALYAALAARGGCAK
jgi:shikimate dehydrogenase